MFESVALPEGQRRDAFHDGGLVIPKVQEKPRLNKPPMIYWMQAAAAAAFTGSDPLRDAIWMYRVPSLLAAIVTVLATWRIGCGMFDARAAALGAALLAVCPLFAWEAHQARADHVMVAATTVAMGALWRVWRDRATDFVSPGTRSAPRDAKGRLNGVPPARSHRHCPRAGNVGGTMSALALWVAVGIGILTKGPITPLIVSSAALALCITTRRWTWLRRTRPVLGVLILAAMIAPWVWAVGERIGWEPYLGIVRDEVLGRSIEAREGHWGPPGYHTVLLAVLFWPGSLTTALAIGRAFRKAIPAPSHMGDRGSAARLRLEFERWGRRAPGRRGELFCLAWILPAWIAFELVLTKLPHYTMPMYPAVALLSARAALSARLPSHRPALQFGKWFWRLWGWFLLSAAWLVCGLGLYGLVVTPRSLGFIGFAILVVLVAATVGATRRFARAGKDNSWSKGLLAGLAVSIPVSIGAHQFVAPAIAMMSHVMVRSVNRVDPEGRRPIAAVDYHEPSLVFLTRGRVELISAEALPAWYESHPNGLWLASLGIKTLRYRGMDTWHDFFWWFNFANGRLQDLYLFDAEKYRAAAELDERP